jgi:guanylate kinase
MEKVPEAVSIFLLPPSFQELENRIRGRSTESEKAIEERLARAKSEMALAKNYKYQVINDSVERAAQEIRSIIAHEISLAKDAD